jgi:cystatin-C
MIRTLRVPLLLLAGLAVALAVSSSSDASPNRPPMRLGGIEEADVKEHGVRYALSYALSEYNKASNDAYHSRLVKVVRARKQVSARAPRSASLPLPPALPASPAPPWLF